MAPMAAEGMRKSYGGPAKPCSMQGVLEGKVFSHFRAVWRMEDTLQGSVQRDALEHIISCRLSLQMKLIRAVGWLPSMP